MPLFCRFCAAFAIFPSLFLGEVGVPAKKSRLICQILYALPQSCCAAKKFNILPDAWLFLAFLSHLIKSQETYKKRLSVVENAIHAGAAPMLSTHGRRHICCFFMQPLILP
ncbi:hypothetical protein AGROH133_11222 [Agrobacterium tumefaciens]|nr:hypothetical protein AGROH133_11222 [Agrobacterium tumefaciens]